MTRSPTWVSALLLHRQTCTRNPPSPAVQLCNQKSSPHRSAGFPYSRGSSISGRWGAVLAVPRSPTRRPPALPGTSLSLPPPLPPPSSAPCVTYNWFKTFLLWTAQACLAQLCGPRGMMLSCSPSSALTKAVIFWPTTMSEPATGSRSLCSHSPVNPCGPGKKQ